MTKHDTWVKLKANSPYEPILDLFPDRMIPMRDPFPLELIMRDDGEQIALWIVDIERLTSIQFNAIAQIIAHYRGADADIVAQEAIVIGGFGMNHEWIDFIACGPEGFQRQKELADFFETAPRPHSARAYREFYNSQCDRWVEGDEVPPPVNSIEDVDPRLRTPKLEQALKMRKIETAIGQGNYSVFDVLTGRAMVDALNQIDPENSYSLIGDDDEFDEDYEE